MADPEAILQLKDIRLELGGNVILDGLTMDVWRGHVHALVGPNGAGKSTTAGAIMGLDGYSSHGGDILFEGKSIRDLPVDERARLGITLAWQEPARFEGLTIRSFLTAAAADPSEERLRASLEAVGLDPDDYLDRAADQTLSGGERKRVELASILAMEPKLVLMDEPDSGIDVEALERIFEALRALKAGGATVLLITHSATVLHQAEHAFLLCGGKVLDKGSIEKVSRYFEDKCLMCDNPNEPDPEEVEATP